MPELPEVETTLRGIQPHISQQTIQKIIIRQHRLRWPIPRAMQQKLQNKILLNIERRAKYLLFRFEHGTAIMHLGMSGSLRVLSEMSTPNKHDHIDIYFHHCLLRYTDPRRFGAFLWTEENPHAHTLLKNLGPEPFDKAFNSQYLYQKAQKKSMPIKSFIMDGKIVVGVGNIYATEALFLAGIHPEMPSKSLSKEQSHHLVKAIKAILKQAIKQGGTTLKDFTQSDGKPGYFKQQLKAYGRAGLPCIQCKNKLIALKIGQRSTVYCHFCQPEKSR